MPCSFETESTIMRRNHPGKPQQPFLMSLLRDVRANTFAIMAMALIPLAGLVGGGVDMSRMYIVKTRLQHACDAGALAGRKAMGGGVWEQTVNGTPLYPRVAAEKFFDVNYQTNAYGSTNLSRAFTEAAGKVSGTASAVVPMTLMRVLGFNQETLTVTCSSEMRLPNTDVMFVLDVTGSMNFKAVTTDSQTKIEALRSSVKCFYEVLAKLDTDEPCIGGAPSGGVGTEVQVRFGFVPYDMNVNVGKLLPSSYFADRWTYQSREIAQIAGLPQSYVDTAGNWTNWSTTKSVTVNQATCSSTYNSPSNASRAAIGLGKNETNGGVNGWGNWDAATPWRDTERSMSSWKTGTNGCKYIERTRDYTRTFTYRRVDPTTANAVMFKAWRYAPIERDVSVLKNGSTWVSDYKYTMPTANDYKSTAYTWDGCVEERSTVRANSYWPIPEDAYDLDIDLVPSSHDDGTRWAPALTSIVYPRRANASNDSNLSAFSEEPILTFTNYTGKGYSCPTAARKLAKWEDASQFDSYVDSMWGGGNTYHDIGMLWGARLLSPSGIFKEENEFTPQGGEIQRHLIFMTDGDACTENYNYQAYGMAWFDRRQTDPAIVPTKGCSADRTPGTLADQVDARTAAICSAVKDRKITLWVIWFGAANTKIETALTACATRGRYFAARNQTDLQNTFRSIANEISQLRLTN